MKILAGPAVRRTQINKVYIWFAVDELPNSFEITCSDIPSMDNENTLGRGELRNDNYVKLGEQLFILLIPVHPEKDAFPVDTKLYYQVLFNRLDLQQMGLTTGSNSIVYNNDILPSFYIPSKHHHIIQGSCRKPHANRGDDRVQYDQFTTIDELLNTDIDNMSQRPSILCLTGDQVYVDDVALPLLCSLKSEAKVLMGWTEDIPHPSAQNRIITPDRIKLQNRNKLLTNDIGFTSGEKNNHLLTFGEIMAMYLSCWGDLNNYLPDYDEIKDDIVRVNKKRIAGKVRSRLRKLSPGRYEHQRQIIKKFLQDAKKARRVLANITTYMIFDDHEVSDDWNLNNSNYQQFQTNPLSRRFQANALAAYWACQAWGNNPDDYDDTFKSTLSDFLTSKSSSDGKQYEKKLLDKSWNYTIQGYPVIVVLDTRTQRNYSEDFSQLMSENNIKNLGDEFKQLNINYEQDLQQQSIILVSASPYLGFKKIERLQLKAVGLSEVADSEPWIGSQTAYDNLKKQLKEIKFGHCCILSGDVHYAFVRNIELPRNNNEDLSVTQIVSSSMHNSPNGGTRLLLNTLAKIDKQHFNRATSPYQYPEGHGPELGENNDFLSGLTNIGIIELENGLPVINKFIFYDHQSNKTFEWRYDLQNANPVIF